VVSEPQTGVAGEAAMVGVESMAGEDQDEEQATDASLVASPLAIAVIGGHDDCAKILIGHLSLTPEDVVDSRQACEAAMCEIREPCVRVQAARGKLCSAAQDDAALFGGRSQPECSHDGHTTALSLG